MTVSEIVNQAWTDCGKHTELDPSVDSSALVSYLNTACERVVTWKGFQGRRRVKFPDYVTTGYKKNLQETEVVDSCASPYEIVVLTSAPSTFTVAEGDYLQFGEEIKMIYYVDGTELWLDSALETDPTGEEVTILQSLLDPSSDPNPFERVMTYLKVENIETLETLKRMKRFSSYIENIGTTGTPTEWAVKSNKISFDVVPDDTYLWRIWYYRLPTLVTTADYTADAEFDLPEEFHSAAEAYMKSLVYKYMQETDMSIAEYQTFSALMSSIQGSWEQEEMISDSRSFGVALS